MGSGCLASNQSPLLESREKSLGKERGLLRLMYFFAFRDIKTKIQLKSGLSGEMASLACDCENGMTR